MASFFRENSPFLKHPLLTEERTEKEIDFIIETLKLTSKHTILDIGCGFGRHSVALSKRGFDVTGIDPSPTMIAAAQARAEDANVSPTLKVMDATKMPFTTQFEGAICLFNTLGQVENDKDNLALLSPAYQALKNGGRLIIEVPNKPHLIATLKTQERFEGPESYALVTRNFDPKSSRITENFEIVSATQKNTYVLKYRIFSDDELMGHLKAAKFELIHLFSGYQESPLTKDSTSMVVVVEKKR